MKIWKYELRIVDEQLINMPADPKILSVVYQGGVLCMWAAIDPDPTKLWERRTIRIVGTGREFSGYENCTFIGTVIDHVNGLVWHVWEEA